MSEHKDKVVLITGAGSGFGYELAKAFAEQGAWVAVNDLTPVNLDSLVEEITKAGGKAQAFLGDVSKKLALQTTVSDVLQTWERIDILVNHASIQPHDPVLDMDEYNWRRTIEVVLTGTFLTTQTVGRVMRELGGGVILNIGPENLETNSETRAAYLAGKAGVVSLTYSSAKELKEYNIKVNALSLNNKKYPSAIKVALELCKDGRSGEVVIIDE